MRRVLATMLLVLAPAVALAQAPDQQAQFKQLAQTTIEFPSPRPATERRGRRNDAGAAVSGGHSHRGVGGVHPGATEAAEVRRRE